MRGGTIVSRGRTVLASLLVAATLLSAALVPASANDLTDKKNKIDQQVQSAHSDLEASSTRLQNAAAALDAVAAKLPAARAEYAAARGRVASARERLAAIRAKVRELRAQQLALQHQVDAAQARIDATQVLMGDIVRQQYQSGGMVELAVVLDASSPSDFVQGLLATQQVLASQSSLVDQVTADKAILGAKEQQLESTVNGIRDAQAQAYAEFRNMRDLAAKARTAKVALEALASRRADALSVARQQRAAERARYNKLVAAQQALQQQIAAAVSSGTVSSGNGVPSGEFLWPVPGPMVQGVGWRVHPVYGYRSCHTGIDIAAGTGTPIEAAASGTVIWTNPDDGGPYGNNTLIDHGNGMSTFYAHQNAFAVSAGETVTKGQVIGYVGSTGYATGPHLHFEIHVNGVPYDPMGWFGGSKTPQSQFCP
ncbi:MAG: peptidoglycan DD-metalloendopeptidase family protein [Actinomycetes bacterium]